MSGTTLEDRDLQADITALAEEVLDRHRVRLTGLGSAGLARLQALRARLGADEARARLAAEMGRLQSERAAAADQIAAVAKGCAPLAVIRQHAVGHGGFHTGALGVRHPLIRWIYDCGAWRRAGKIALKAKLQAYGKLLGPSEQVDLLFLSHFDADHISGIRLLLHRVPVETVIVPYLEPEEAFGVIAGAAAARTARRDMISLAQALLTPGDWFGDRGVDRVIRLRPGPVIADGEPAEHPETAPSGRPFSIALEDALGAPVIARSVGARVIDAEPGLTGKVIAQSGVVTDWRFRPFTHPVSAAAQAQLRTAAEALVGLAVRDPGFNGALLAQIGERHGLKRLRDIYVHEELEDANGKSLSLYVGSEHEALRRRLGPHARDGYATGWLLTGDAKLRNRERRAAWHQHFHTQGRRVGTLMVPHHGAAANFHHEVVALAPFAELFVTAQDGDPLRPHEDVLAELDEHDDGRPIERVTEDSRSEIWGISGASEYESDPLVQSRGYEGWT